MDCVTTLPLLGQTFFEGQSPPTTYDASRQVEGRLAAFQDLPQTKPANGPISLTSGRQPCCRFTRNLGAAALSGGAVCRADFTSGNSRDRTAGITNTAAMKVLGIVHHHYGTGAIVQHDLGWLVEAGPCWANKDGAAYTAGDRVVCDALGQVVAVAAPANDQDAVDDAINFVGEVLTDALAGDAQVYIDVQLTR